MLLKFCGAAKEVTGSNYLLEAGGHRLLIDCGMHQGEREEANDDPFPYAAGSIDAVLLTHAHIDHSGRIPKLVKEGFRGKIYATLPTIELTEILWDDSVRLMREDAEWQSAKNARRGLPPAEPIYGQEEADAAKKLFAPVNYDSRLEILPGVSVRFRDAGHILGSAILEILIEEEGRIVRLVFSGDLGPMQTVMGRAPAEITDADYVVIESTYGNREHKDNRQTREEFQTLMKDIFAKKKGKVFIPTFVVDRAQRIMYELELLRGQGVGGGMPVFFDSPMGVKVSKLYESHLDLLSQEIQAYRRDGGNPFSSEDIRYVSTREESQAVNNLGFGVVMAGSGMCNGGRIVHHLKNGIWNPDNHVVFVGYQAHGTLGRRIVDRAKTVRIAGEVVNVNAQIHTIGGFSAHADRTDLLGWAERFRPTMPKFFVTHGEAEAAQSLAEALKTRGFEALVPELDQEVALVPREAGQKLSEAIADAKAAPLPEKIAETETPADPGGAAVAEEKGAPVAKVETAPSVSVAEKTLTKEQKKTAEKKARRANRRAVKALENISDQMREIYEKAGSGEIAAESQPLLDAVAVLLDSIIAQSGKDAARN
ncbi:MBL fold metallo-hydrolase RNA specificity domain-containing protein [Pyramidobacter sp. YE332]|uniref:MBL fold metallo-hydrolase RNA specificity domain-containing protein n=1 Tax=unclassified Pyramidobacter TaxID=2632171 RepID=UPI00098EA8F0|nr:MULTISPECIES: MBL fold metallo-hydrolase RNA specificity domain-containing protein [unclassified Pyramidobacter]OON87580.1 MBL fold hydrolase [Pyramidobacter sp. C12-8]WOL38981.1 MBL fold metallo-hydrolase RNA specificity domain-containing protein [Pyramidobacter sp. YE332]